MYIKSILILASIVVSLSITSCTQHPNDSHQQGAEAHQHDAENNEEQSAEVQTHSDDHVLRTNNGVLWEANPETTAGITAMKNTLNQFNGSGNLEEYKALKESLLSKYNLIFQNCTMTGPAHDQLHNYLVPMRDYMEGLGAEDLSVCKKNLGELTKHLFIYSDYFQ